MATVQSYGGTPANANLSTAQTGNAASTNVVDRGPSVGAALLKVTTTVGATPTVTIAIEGSADGVNFFNVAYATAAAPETPVVAAVVITTATTNYYILRPGHPWRYLRLTYSANTNVTTTADLWTF
jgi:hypothetical protein